MEDRIARLEKATEKMGDQIVTIREDIATIKENIRHLPTKPWMFGALLMLLTAVGTIVAIVVRFVPHAG